LGSSYERVVKGQGARKKKGFRVEKRKGRAPGHQIPNSHVGKTKKNNKEQGPPQLFPTLQKKCPNAHIASTPTKESEKKKKTILVNTG